MDTLFYLSISLFLAVMLALPILGYLAKVQELQNKLCKYEVEYCNQEELLKRLKTPSN